MTVHGSPADVKRLGEQAVAAHKSGQLEEAERLYLQIRMVAPEDFTASYMLGVLRFNQERDDEAAQLLDIAIRQNRGAIGPLIYLGLLLQRMGRPGDALACFDRALALDGNLVEALVNRGNVLCQLGRFAEALTSHEKALRLRPQFELAWYNCGIALLGLNRPQDALTSFNSALAIRPDYPDALSNRGSTLRALGRFSEALESYDRALAKAPDNVAAWTDRGLVLQSLERLDDALASYDRALLINPDSTQALYGRGMLLGLQLRRLDAARRDLEKLILLHPDQDYLRGDLLYLRLQGADWAGIEEEFAAMDAGVRAGKRVIRPFVYQAISDCPADLLVASNIYATPEIANATTAKIKAHDRAKIRVGYVSGEFREQATAFLTAGLYEAHDKSKFEIIAFDSGFSDHGATRKRLEASFDKFVGIAALPDDEAAALIKAEQIDILVNLNGYFGLERSGIFARKPAPIQVNYLGFPATLGASCMDYILADRIVIPDNEKLFYTEQVVILPDSYQVNDSRRPVADNVPARAECGLPGHAFVFCNFNHSYKLLPAMFAVWIEILKQAPGSVLWLLESNTEFSHRLRQEAERKGVAGERLIFAPIVPTDRHLARMKLADLFLDCLPYNAHTTASDSLWAGLPLLTCRGNAFPGRVATSLLLAMNLPELVTENLDAYQALALRLARDPELLRTLREKLACNRLTAPLFDTDRFRRHIEAAYTMMWDIFRRGEAPRSFTVEAIST